MRVYRKLVPFENWRLEQHLLRLTPEDRATRFSGGVGEATLVEHCRRLDWLRAVVIGCFEAGVLRGAAELWLDPPAGRAELAVTVERDWQGGGVGTALVDRALTVAANRGSRSVTMLCLTENRRMQRIARRFEGRLLLQDGQAEADLKVPWLGQLSLWQEAAADGIGLAGTLFEQFWRPLRPAPEAGAPPVV